MIQRVFYAGMGILFASFLTTLHAQSCSFSAESGPNPGNYAYSVLVSLSTSGASTQQAGPSCTYNLNIDYEIQLAGASLPPNLYTLQGTVVCYGDEIFFNLPLNTSSGTVQASTANLDPALCDTMGFNCGYIIEIEGPGIAAGEYACIQGAGSGSSILPVDLLSFSGEPVEEGVRLHWTVANEINNFGFFVQRSSNGEDWSEIGFISGRGDAPTQTSYEYIDSAPLYGNNYYRLKQVDYNGTSELFSIIAVSVESSFSSVRYAYPSPFQDQLTLQGPSEEIIIYDELGRMKARESSIYTPHTVSVSDWVKGIYVVRAVDPFGQVHYQKLLKN